MNIGFVTYASETNLYEDDRLAQAELKKLGFNAEPVIWDSKQDWRKYNALIIRSVWDYWLKYDLFLDWISQIENLKVPLFNPPSILRENTRKTYLRRLEDQGVATLPTRWLERNTQETLQSALKDTGWGEVVLKPSLSGGAYRTWRIKSGEASGMESNLTEILSGSEAMIQPLAPSIFNEGEFSFLFYGGEFSHATLKRAPKDEFRIQRIYGGTVSPYKAKVKEIAQAENALKAYTNEDLLYARIDMIRDEKDSNQLLLMEVEATEPNLFFLHDQENPGAARRFATVLKEKYLTSIS